MRFLKRLLVAIYGFLGVFAVVCLMLWVVTGDEPVTLITGVFAAAGVESVVGGIIKFKEAKEATKPDVSEETEAENNGRAE
jgi:hypothetical protein